MYIVFHGNADPEGPAIAKFDDLAKIESHYGRIDGRDRLSRTGRILARKTDDDRWIICDGPSRGQTFQDFWTGNNTEVYAALQAIASGFWAGPACALIARDALEGRDGVSAAIERLDSGVFI